MLDPNGKLPEGVEPVVMPVSLTSIVAISVCRVSVPKDLRPHENRLSVLLAIQVRLLAGSKTFLSSGRQGFVTLFKARVQPSSLKW